MKVFNELFTKSAVAEQMLVDDAKSRRETREACLRSIEALHGELKALPVKELAKLEKAVIDAQAALESARKSHSEAVAKISQQRRKIEKQIQAHEADLLNMAPLAIHAATEKLSERVQRAGAITPEQSGRVGSLFRDIKALCRVADENQLMAKLGVINREIEAL